MPTKTSKPICKLTGTDGNVFAIIGNVSTALRRGGQIDKVEEFQKKAFSAHSYNEVLQLCHKYVEVQ